MADIGVGDTQAVTIESADIGTKLAINPDGSLNSRAADTSGSGTIAALNGAVAASTVGQSTITFNVTGTWVATLTFQATVDGTNWFIVYGTVAGTDATTELIASDNPVIIPCGGFTQVRLIATAYTSGTASLAWATGRSPNTVLTFSPVAASFNATIVATSLPLPTGAATDASLVTIATDLSTINANLTNGNMRGVMNIAPATLWVTATAATGVAVTLTLPAVAAQFHYITSMEIEAYTTAARTGSATPILVTTTNLPGSPVFTFATAAAIGTTDTKTFQFTGPIKSATVNTATTIVCPATTGIIWRVNVSYLAAA
jgi:hypothetical protein